MKCPKNCTIYIEGTVTAYDGGTGNIALCYDVDGSFGSCAYLGPLSPGGFSERTYQETFSGLGKGTHTVQTYEETDNAATLGYWTIKYDIYRNT